MPRYSIKSPPNEYTYAGYGYEAASRAAVEVCKLAVDTGQTINASLHLDALRNIMLRNHHA